MDWFWEDIFGHSSDEIKDKRKMFRIFDFLDQFSLQSESKPYLDDNPYLQQIPNHHWDEMFTTFQVLSSTLVEVLRIFCLARELAFLSFAAIVGSGENDGKFSLLFDTGRSSQENMEVSVC